VSDGSETMGNLLLICRHSRAGRNLVKMFIQTCCKEHKPTLPHYSVCMRWRRSTTVYTGTLYSATVYTGTLYTTGVHALEEEYHCLYWYTIQCHCLYWYTIHYRCTCAEGGVLLSILVQYTEFQ